MKATIIGCVIGVLGFDEKGKLIGRELFPKDAAVIAEKLAEIESGRIVKELAALIQNLKEKGYTTFIFESHEIARKVHEEMGVDVDVEKPSSAGETLRENMGKFAVETRFVKEPVEITRWIHDVSMELTKTRIKKATEKRDLLVSQTIMALDDLDKTTNLFMNRVREWYGLHLPELDGLVEKHETYARLVLNLGNKENFTMENLEKEGLPMNKSLQVSHAAKSSMGADLYGADLDQIRLMCRQTLQLYETKASLEKYLDGLMGEVAPNLHALAGPTLGARLIALAGGLSNLAKMPASTVQVLGAEKALFRSLKTGARPPKHGIIFQHPLIHGAKRWLRGKLARALAGKLMIAIRADAFSGGYIGDRLKEGLNRRIGEIEKRYAEPKPYEKKPKEVRKKGERRGRKG